jgi:emericellamide synthase (highly reducing iterative type I polyketide synthase)
MTVDQWQQALAPKIRGTMNLHRCFGNDLDFFVTMSSSVAISGNVGQSNYAAACSFQDALARHRAAAGMAAYSINISGVQEVGFVSENPEVVAVSGPRLGCVHISELLSLLNYAITRPPSNDPAESSCAIGLLPKDDAAFTIEKHGRMDKRFAHLFWHDVVSQNEDESVCLLQLLNNVSQLGDAVDIICNAILQQLGKLIATPVEMLNSARDLDSYGVDSLVAVELRNWIGTYLQANVQLMVMRNIASINELAKLVAKESRLVNFEAA